MINEEGFSPEYLAYEAKIKQNAEKFKVGFLEVEPITTKLYPRPKNSAKSPPSTKVKKTAPESKKKEPPKATSTKKATQQTLDLF